MKRSLLVVLIALLLSASPAWAITVNAQVEGPLLTKDRVLDYVQQNLAGAIAEIPELEQGGKYRLFVRVASKHVGKGSWYLYFTEVQMQRRVTEAQTARIYWATLRSAVLWGTVPTENEVRDALESLMKNKVSQWQAE
ncbi:MAG: hypothetical protein PVH25_00845 [Burkholderiales bacterium]